MANKKFRIPETLCLIVGVLLGIVMIFIDSSILLAVLLKLVGIFLIIIYAPRAVISLGQMNTKIGRIDFWISLIGTIIGATVIFLPGAAITAGMIVAGIWFIVLPVVDIIYSKYRLEQFKAELPKIIIGIVIVILGPTAFVSVLFKILGVVITVISAVALGMGLKSLFGK